MSKKLLVILKNQWSITKFNNLPANLKGRKRNFEYTNEKLTRTKQNKKIKKRLNKIEIPVNKVAQSTLVFVNAWSDMMYVPTSIRLRNSRKKLDRFSKRVLCSLLGSKRKLTLSWN